MAQKKSKKIIKNKRVASAKIQKKNTFTSFISSFIVFFFIPIWVCLIKMIEVMYNLLSNFSLPKLPISYKLIFMIIIFSSIAINIKQDLGSTFLGIYSIFSLVAIVIFIHKNKKIIIDDLGLSSKTVEPAGAKPAGSNSAGAKHAGSNSSNSNGS